MISVKRRSKVGPEHGASDTEHVYRATYTEPRIQSHLLRATYTEPRIIIDKKLFIF